MKLQSTCIPGIAYWGGYGLVANVLNPMIIAVVLFIGGVIYDSLYGKLIEKTMDWIFGTSIEEYVDVQPSNQLIADWNRSCFKAKIKGKRGWVFNRSAELCIPGGLVQFERRSIRSDNWKLRRWSAERIKERALVGSIQLSLSDLGYMRENQVDGEMGPLTRDALRRYQRNKGFRVSGEIDSRTRRALIQT